MQIARTRPFAELLGDFGEDRDGLAFDLDLELERRVQRRERTAGEFDVDDGTGDADDAAVGARRLLDFGDSHSASPLNGAVSSSTSVTKSRATRTADVVATARERFGATDDFHDLGGDRVLPSPVHHPAERLDQLFGVVGSGLHRPLTEGVLRRRSIEHRGVHTGLDVTRQQRVEDRAGVGLVLVVAAGCVGRAGSIRLPSCARTPVAAGHRLHRQRHERAEHDLLVAGGDEPRVHQLDLVDRPTGELLDDVGGDALGVLQPGRVGESGERLAELVAAEVEVPGALATDRDDHVLPTVHDVGLHFPFGGPLHAGVVPAAQPAIGGEGDVARRRDRLASGEQRCVRARSGRGQVTDHLGDLFRSRARRRRRAVAP